MTMKVRDVLRRLEDDGWGSPRTSSEDARFGLQTGRLEVRYIAIIETDGASWNAYVPDLPGCVAVRDSRQEVAALIREAVPLHLESLRGRGECVPEPSAIAALDVDAA